MCRAPLGVPSDTQYALRPSKSRQSRQSPTVSLNALSQDNPNGFRYAHTGRLSFVVFVEQVAYCFDHRITYVIRVHDAKAERADHMLHGPILDQDIGNNTV